MAKNVKNIKVNKKKVRTIILAIILAVILSAGVLGGLYKLDVIRLSLQSSTPEIPEEPAPEIPEEPLIPDAVLYESYLAELPVEPVIDCDKYIDGSYIYCNYNLKVSVNDIIDLRDHVAYSYFDLESLIDNGYTVHSSLGWADDSSESHADYIEWIPVGTGNLISNYSRYKVLDNFDGVIRLSLHFINYAKTYTVITHRFYISINND